jgi:hypothetical protein
VIFECRRSPICQICINENVVPFCSGGVEAVSAGQNLPVFGRDLWSARKPMAREAILGPRWFAGLFAIFAGIDSLLLMLDGVSNAGFSIL